MIHRNLVVYREHAELRVYQRRGIFMVADKLLGAASDISMSKKISPIPLQQKAAPEGGQCRNH
jgi:hypothetical protein